MPRTNHRDNYVIHTLLPMKYEPPRAAQQIRHG